MSSKATTSNFFVCLVPALLLSLFAWFYWQHSFVLNDGVQYMSTASNFLQGLGFSTNALIYDAHYQGVVPAPQTVWPLGYPILISMGAALGLSLEHSALLINLIAQILSAGFIGIILVRCGATRLAAIIAATAYCLLINPWHYTLALMADPIMNMCMLAVLALLPASAENRRGMWILCGLFTALAISTRYSAVLFAAAVMLGLFFRHGHVLLLNNTARRKGFLNLFLYASLPIALFVVLMLRNKKIIGSFLPNNGFDESMSLVGTVGKFVSVFMSFLGFDSTILPATVNKVLFLIILLLIILSIAVALYVSVVKRGGINYYKPDGYIELLLMVIAINSILFIVYFAYKTLTIGYPQLLPRYFLQLFTGLYVFFCVLLVKAWSSQAKTTLQTRTLFVSTLLLFLAVQLGQTNTVLAMDGKQKRFLMTQSAIEKTLPSGLSLKELISQCYPLPEGKNTSSPASLWSNEAQLLHYHTGLPALTLPDENRTQQPYDWDRISNDIDTYNVKMMIIVDSDNGVVYSQSFDTLRQWFSDAGFKELKLSENSADAFPDVTVFLTDDSCELTSD